MKRRKETRIIAEDDFPKFNSRPLRWWREQQVSDHGVCLDGTARNRTYSRAYFRGVIPTDAVIYALHKSTYHKRETHNLWLVALFCTSLYTTAELQIGCWRCDHNYTCLRGKIATQQINNQQIFMTSRSPSPILCGLVLPIGLRFEPIDEANFCFIHTACFSALATNNREVGHNRQ